MNFLDKEPLQVALLLHPSNWQKVEDYYDEDPNKALAYLMMIGRYHFYREEPSSFVGIFPRDTIRDANAERPLLDAKVEKYEKSAKGGKASNKVSDEEFVKMIGSEEFSTQEEIANALNVSKQAVSQRLKKLGIDWKEFKKAKNANVSKAKETESESTFERQEPNIQPMDQVIAHYKNDLL